MANRSGGLGQALAEGFGGLAQGRANREQQAYERAQQAERERKDAERQEFAQWMATQNLTLAQQGQAATAAERTRQTARDAAQDAKSDFEGGYVRAPEAKAQGDTMAAVHGGDQPVYGAIMDSIGRLGADWQTKAAGPAAFTRDGVGMVKAGESLEETRNRRELAERQAETQGAREWQVTHDKQRDTANEATQRRLFAQQDQAQARRDTAADARARQPLPRPLTEGERRATGLAMVAGREKDILTTLGDPSVEDRIAQSLPLKLGRGAMSDQSRQYESAALAFAQSYLYTVSGAAAPDGEVEKLMRQIVPSPLDGPTQLAAKAARREQMHKTMLEIGGRGAAQAPSPAPAGQRPSLGTFMRQP